MSTAAQVTVPKLHQDTLPEESAWIFTRAANTFMRRIEKALRPLIPNDPSFSLDIHVTIRRGKIKVTTTPQQTEGGWQDRSGG